MERKLIKQGIGGLTFYVPSKWVKERNLEAGNIIDIEEAEGKLILSTKKYNKKQEIEIEIENQSKEFIRNYLNQLYRLGYDKIKINSKSNEKLLLCKKFIQMFLLGFEIIEDKKDYCIAENVSEPSKEKESAILRRIFFLIESSFEILSEDLKKSKPTHKKDINRNTRKVTQYDNFLRRTLVKQNLAFGRQFFRWELYNSLLLIQHSFFHIYDHKFTIKDKDFFSTSLKTIKENFSGIYHAFFNKNIEELDNSQNKANQFLIEIQKQIKPNKQLDSIMFHYFSEIIRLQYLTCSPMISILKAEKI